jgi:methylthioribose-1-phosphate isomerase
MVDQRLMPSTFTIIHLESYQEVSDAIRNMTVRGAPAIGVAAAYGKESRQNLRGIQAYSSEFAMGFKKDAQTC